MSSADATPRATASARDVASIATVRATIMPGTSSMTLTVLAGAWKRPIASWRLSGEVACAADSGDPGGRGVVERQIEVDDLSSVELEGRLTVREAQPPATGQPDVPAAAPARGP